MRDIGAGFWVIVLFITFSRSVCRFKVEIFDPGKGIKTRKLPNPVHDVLKRMFGNCEIFLNEPTKRFRLICKEKNACLKD